MYTLMSKQVYDLLLCEEVGPCEENNIVLTEVSSKTISTYGG